MIKSNCPRSGLAQRWAPRLRTTFIVLLCFVILTLSLPLGAFASSGVQMYDYNGFQFPALPFLGDSYNAFIFQFISTDTSLNGIHLVLYINSSDGVTYMPYINSSGSLKVYGKPAVFYKLDSDSWVFTKRYTTASGISYSGFIYSNYLDFISSNKDDSGFLIWCSENISNDYSNSVIIGSSPVPVQTQSTEYFITSENNVNQLYTGESLQLYCQTTEGVQAESVTWSIQNVSDYTGLSISSSGLFSVSSDTHSIGNVTVQASDINGTYTYTTFELTIFDGENPDSGGDTGSDGEEGGSDTTEPGNQEVIDEITQGVTDITDGLDDVQSSIDDGFTDMGDKIEDTGNSIVENLLDGILHLFVPTSEELSAKMDDFKEWIDDNIPLLSVPISLVQYMYDMFFGVTPELGVLTFPQISWMDNVIIEETDLDLNQYTWLSDLLPIIRTVMTAGCALAFINWLRNKVGEVSKT